MRGVCLLALSWLALAGCCSVCDEENLPDSRHRRTPEESVAFVQYAVEQGCYDVAYDAISKRTQEALSRTEFKIALIWDLTIPGRKVSLYDFIVSSRLLRLLPHPLNRAWRYAYLRYTAPDGSEDFLQTLIVLQESGRWQLGLLESLQEGLLRSEEMLEAHP